MSQGLERYQVMEPLGTGGQGKTFRAIDRLTGNLRAIKTINLKDIGGDWKRFDLFEREAGVLKRLNHPGIPKFHDSFAHEQSGDFFLVMDLVEGKSFKQWRESGRRFEAKELPGLFEQALDILEYLHGSSPPIFHRDIKPSNLILGPDPKAAKRERLSLIDFGSVHVVQHLKEVGGSTMIGTLGYLAPEQLHGEVTAASDLYSLAVTFVSVAAGIDGDELSRDGLKIDIENHLPPSHFRDVIDRCLNPNPKDRYSKVQQVRHALKHGVEPHHSNATPAASQSNSGNDSGKEPDDVKALVLSREMKAIASLPPPISLPFYLFSRVALVLLGIADAVLLPLLFKAMELNQDRREVDLERKETEARIDKLRKTFKQMRDVTGRSRNRFRHERRAHRYRR